MKARLILEKDVFKPKSNKEILNIAKDLKPIKQLILGIQHGILILVKRAVELGVDPSGEGGYRYDNWPIKIAASQGNVKIVKYLLQQGVNPNTFENRFHPPPIIQAAGNNHLDVVIELMKNEKVNPAIDNNLALHKAAVRGYVEIVKKLLEDSRVKMELKKGKHLTSSTEKWVDRLIKSIRSGIPKAVKLENLIKIKKLLVNEKYK